MEERRRLHFTKSQVRDWIEEAKSLVEDEEEPFRSIAFRVILNRLIVRDAVEEGIRAPAEKVTEEGESLVAKIVVPEEMVNQISALGDPDKIPILWSMSDREWMKVDDFLTAAADVGMSIAKSWSPKQGGNFNNRLFRERKLFVKKGEGKEATYKLSAEGKQKVKELLEQQKA
jgi:hypothetical protein